jgi:hypothetical protein
MAGFADTLRRLGFELTRDSGGVDMGQDAVGARGATIPSSTVRTDAVRSGGGAGAWLRRRL